MINTFSIFNCDRFIKYFKRDKYFFDYWIEKHFVMCMFLFENTIFFLFDRSESKFFKLKVLENWNIFLLGNSKLFENMILFDTWNFIYHL